VTLKDITPSDAATLGTYLTVINALPRTGTVRTSPFHKAGTGVLLL